MEIVTGYRGEAHISSDDKQALNAGVIGDVILPIGRQLEAELHDVNTLRIYDGTAVMGGVEFRVLPNTHDDVAIASGEQNKNRIDLVCARYQKNGSTGVESMSWAVVKGTATSGTPVQPTYKTGDIVAGATDVYFPMYRIRLTGLNATAEALCGVLKTAVDVQAAVAELPRCLIKSSVVVNSTTLDDITLWTVPSDIDLNQIAVTVTNPYYNVNNALPIATYIDNKNRLHAKMNVSRVVGFCRVNFIVWYWGD